LGPCLEGKCRQRNIADHSARLISVDQFWRPKGPREHASSFARANVPLVAHILPGLLASMLCTCARFPRRAMYEDAQGCLCGSGGRDHLMQTFLCFCHFAPSCAPHLFSPPCFASQVPATRQRHFPCVWPEGPRKFRNRFGFSLRVLTCASVLCPAASWSVRTRAHGRHSGRNRSCKRNRAVTTSPPKKATVCVPTLLSRGKIMRRLSSCAGPRGQSFLQAQICEALCVHFASLP